MSDGLEVLEQIATTDVLHQQTVGFPQRAAAQHADHVRMVAQLLHQADLAQKLRLVLLIAVVCKK